MRFEKDSEDGCEYLESDYSIKQRNRTEIKLDVTRFLKEDKPEVEIISNNENEIYKITLEKVVIFSTACTRIQGKELRCP